MHSASSTHTLEHSVALPASTEQAGGRSLRVLLIAEEAAGVQTLRMLAGSTHEVVAVMTRGAGMGAIGATVAGVASRLGYRLWPAQRSREPGFADVIRQEKIDLLLNVHSLYILPPEVIAAPLIGSFNLHPGPLPRYAGLNAPCWAIYHGERTHGVSLHWMDRGIDTGPIAFAAELPVENDDTGLTLSAKCVRAGLPLLHDLLLAASRCAVPRMAQSGPRRYYGHEVPHQGRLVWSESAARIVNFVRACDYAPFASPWGVPRAYLNGREVVVLKAARTGERTDAEPGTVGRRVGTDMLVAARDEWVRLHRVRIGSSTFPAADALREGDRFVLPAGVEGSPAAR
jgi:UDP-4-amino-4-deoxy-L-arabinose formyltransferase/UDP-glucuronic acid dehydrogenase (UDP-4-keto-hexauronic acid decarboxylating)